jgi:peroxisome-assembly ATPase
MISFSFVKSLAIRRGIRYVNSFSEGLQTLIESGNLRYDRAQQRVARRFDKLQEALATYDNQALVAFYEDQEKQELMSNLKTNKVTEMKDGINGNIVSNTSQSPFPIPRGLYIYGSVGVGKSMLMDTFFSQISLEKKRRVHFHAFLQDVHQRIYRLKQHDLQTLGRDFHVNIDRRHNPIIRVARELAKEVTLLCFDEFQVTDVADALILKQLFTTLFQYGTVIVATSNRPPSALYENGINRGYFLPFITLLERHCIVHEINSDMDYRRFLNQDLDQYFFPIDVSNPKCNTNLERIHQILLDGKEETKIELNVRFRRTLTVHRAHPDRIVARFSFSDLCQNDLGAADYRALAQTFPFLILEHIPQLNLTQHDEARRFITLIDELYEHRCALMCSASVTELDELFLDQPQKGPPPAPTAMELKIGEALGIDVAQSQGKPISSLASVRELSFAFRRASSRLRELCSIKHWENTWERIESTPNDNSSI